VKNSQKIYAFIMAALWAVALLGLPLTSFPVYAELTNAIVAPFSAVPILLLLCLWLLPRLLRREKLPIESQLLFIFLLWAVIASAQAFFLHIPTFKESTPLSQEFRAFITLAIGISFYLVFSSFSTNETALRRTLQWINLGGGLLVLITLPQVYYILIKAAQYPKWIYITTDWLTKRTPYFFYVNRVSGLTYEPSWFGHQMILFFLPLWLAATLAQTSTFRFRIIGFSLENILLGLGSVEFMLSAPRISLIGVLLIGIALVVRGHHRLVQKISQLIVRRLPHPPSRSKERLIRLLMGLLAIIFLISAGAALFFITLKRDARMAYFFMYPPTWKDIQGVLSLNELTLLVLANRMAFFERAIYWFSGLHVFNQFPWFGVGLGNAGFFFLQKVPSIGWTSYEILTLLNEQTFLPNTKSLFVRLLAETGLVGFSIFILFLYAHWRSTRLLSKAQSPTLRLISLAGQFSLLAMIGEGFSIDSFAMPYLWVFTGLVAAAGMIYRQQLMTADPFFPKEPEQSVPPHVHPHTDLPTSPSADSAPAH
jgi:hypothetical protein